MSALKATTRESQGGRSCDCVSLTSEWYYCGR